MILSGVSPSRSTSGRTNIYIYIYIHMICICILVYFFIWAVNGRVTPEGGGARLAAGNGRVPGGRAGGRPRARVCIHMYEIIDL